MVEGIWVGAYGLRAYGLRAYGVDEWLRSYNAQDAQIMDD